MRKKNIHRLLRSILNQEVSPSEIIIVDGGSTDKTFAILKEYFEEFPQIRLFQYKSNIAQARNFAIERAKGDIIFVSDAGCTIDRTWIKDTMRFFPKYDLVAGNYKAIANNNFEYMQSLINIQEVDRPSRMSSRNLAFKKDVWEDVGGYPEQNLAGEDTLFNIRAIEMGFRIKINPEKHISWEMRKSYKDFFRQFVRYGQGDRVQGNLLKMKKNLVMVVGFWVYLLALIASIFYSVKLFAFLVLVPIIYLGYVALKGLFKTRKITALWYLPIFTILKRVGYIYGATFSRKTIRYGEDKNVNN